MVTCCCTSKSILLAFRKNNHETMVSYNHPQLNIRATFQYLLFFLYTFDIDLYVSPICSWTLQMMQIADYHARAVSTKPPKRPLIKERKQKLLAFLQGMSLLQPDQYVILSCTV
jgi:hypothetical protein